MATIILCFPAQPTLNAQLPIGLYKIAAFIAGRFNVHIVDGRIENPSASIEKILSQDEVIYLGLSVMTGSQITHAAEISKQFHGRIPIVWGGLHPTILPEETLRAEYIDYVVVGEGEYQASQLAKALSLKSQSLPKIPGYNCPPFPKQVFDSFTSQGILPYKNIEIPSAYITERDGMSRALALETSRGCPHSCKFCHNSISKSKYRTCSPEDADSSITFLEENYGIDGIIFQEDNFFANNKRTEAILNYLIERHTINWKANSRLSYFNNRKADAILSTAIEAGCTMLQCGIESGSDRILNYIDKGLTTQVAIDTNKLLARHAIPVKYNFIIGFPGETRDEISKTLDLIVHLKNNNSNIVNPFVNIYTPYPGTKLYKDAISYGFKPPSNLEGWADVNWNLPTYSLHGNNYDFLLQTSRHFLEQSQYSKFMKGV